MKSIFGLIGFPLEHSQSPKIFSEIFLRHGMTDAEFKLFPLQDIRGIRSLVRTNDLKGFSVTIPHKTTIIPYLDELSNEASGIGAVNAVKVKLTKGKMFLKGFNTDAPAFLETLKPILIHPDTRALVLGSGGASRAVCHALKTLKISYIIASRNPVKAGQINYSSISDETVRSHLLIINTTPLGMFPEVELFPVIPYEILKKDHIVYDLIYNPEETVFLQKARQSGAKTKNGLEMLQLQAELAWKIWNTET